MNLVFDIDDTLYDLMEPFRLAHEKYFASRTSADVTELFRKSRHYSDMILSQEKQGLIAPEAAFSKRIQMTYQDAGLAVSDDACRLFETEYRLRQKEITLFPCIEETLNYAPEESWYVGDTYLADIISADAAGWHSIWFNHRKRNCQTETLLADIEVQNTEDLLDVIIPLLSSP